LKRSGVLPKKAGLETRECRVYVTCEWRCS